MVIVNFSWSTFATGARQFVVQDALETTWCLLTSKAPSLTPRQMVTSAFLEGAETMTWETEPRRCAAAFSRAVKRPVASMTTSIPKSDHGISFGSGDEKIRISFPSTETDCWVEVT